MNYKKICANRFYINLERWNSYYYQINVIMDLVEKINKDNLEILEIGGSNNFIRIALENYFRLNNIKHSITTMDIDSKSQPDVVGDIRKIPLKDKRFDMTICFEVLEHIPYHEINKALYEMKRVTKKFIIISVPHDSIYLSFAIKLPLLRLKNFFIKITDPFYKKYKPRKNVPFPHYWEIGYRPFSLKKFKNLIESSELFIVRDFRNPLFPYHHFFYNKSLIFNLQNIL